MHRGLTHALAGLLIVLVVGRPTLLDRCVAACAAQSTAAAPTCHHADADTVPRLGATPRPCGHDHQAVLLAGDSVAAHDPLSLAQALSDVAPVSLPATASAVERLGRADPPRPQRSHAARHIPLRV